jgi:hypothetical protein
MANKIAVLVAVLAALAVAPSASASGPIYALQGGGGVVLGSTRYVPVGDYNGNSTDLLAISTKDGTIHGQTSLVGEWGLPATPAGAEGLSRNGHTLVLSGTQAGFSSPSLFLVVNPKTMRIARPITLPGYFAYDAVSPDGSRLYLVQFTQGANNDLEHYVVRAYDLRTHRLLPGRIADRTQKSWVMQGYPVTRTASADGRWVYTLYTNPGGYPFIHALDTVRGVAHCVGLPLRNQTPIYNLVLALHGRTLSVHWRSGRPYLNVETKTWRVSPAPAASFPWWTLAFAALPLAGAWALLLRRARGSRRDGELALVA